MAEDVSFVLDTKLREVNQELEKLVFQINNPLAGEKIFIIKKFTRGLINAYAKERALTLHRSLPSDALVMRTETGTFDEPEFNLPPLDESPFAVADRPTKLPRDWLDSTVKVQPRVSVAKKPLVKVVKKRLLPKPLPKKLPEEKISLITSKITNEEMAYGLQKGMFYFVHEAVLEPDEITVLNAMRPLVEKKQELFQDKQKFTKVMLRMARKNKVPKNELSPSKLRYFLIKHLVNFGLIDPLLHDTAIIKVVCDGPKLKLKILRDTKELITNLEFKSEKYLNDFLKTIAQRKGVPLDEGNPTFDVTFEHFRMQATLGVAGLPSTFIVEKTI